MTRKKQPPPASLARSSPAEYLTFVAASGTGGVETVYADENVSWLSHLGCTASWRARFARRPPLATFELPARAARRASPIPDEASTCRRVLVVEDNATSQMLAQRFLKRAGFACGLADSGQDGLSALEREFAVRGTGGIVSLPERPATAPAAP